jgi:hypothetical protein
MFVQVIQGKTNDAEGFNRQIERWQTELKPGAKGYLGSTGGVALDGTVIAIVRFESEEAAQANSERPEQGAWFEELTKYFDGEPTFRNSTDVQSFKEGGSDKAGFVQVMIYDVKDRPALEKLEEKVMPELMNSRSDLIGGVRVWDGNTAVDVNYFTSEATARENEKKMGAEMAEQMEQFQGLAAGEPTFIDLPNPQLNSA